MKELKIAYGICSINGEVVKVRKCNTCPKKSILISCGKGCVCYDIVDIPVKEIIDLNTNNIKEIEKFIYSKINKNYSQ